MARRVSAPIRVQSAESRLRPLPGHLSVREAREAYLEENGFTVAGYDASDRGYAS